MTTKQTTRKTLGRREVLAGAAIGGAATAAAAVERRAGRFNSRDHPADDQAPLPLASSGGGAPPPHGAAGKQQLHFASLNHLDWRDEIETCKQQLEALGGLFGGM